MDNNEVRKEHENKEPDVIWAVLGIVFVIGAIWYIYKKLVNSQYPEDRKLVKDIFRICIVGALSYVIGVVILILVKLIFGDF